MPRKFASVPASVMLFVIELLSDLNHHGKTGRMYLCPGKTSGTRPRLNL